MTKPDKISSQLHLDLVSDRVVLVLYNPCRWKLCKSIRLVSVTAHSA